MPNEPVPTIDDHVDNLLTDPWPLSDQQRDRLVELLAGRRAASSSERAARLAVRGDAA